MAEQAQHLHGPHRELSGGANEDEQRQHLAGARHPLGWIAVLAGLMLVTRAREVLSLLVFIRSAAELAVRAVQVLRLFGHRDAPRAAGAAAASPAAPTETRPGHA